MHRTFLRAALIVAAATAFNASAAGDEGGVDWTKCRGGQGISNDDRIVACSEIISSGKVTGDKLGFAYRFRGDAYQANSNRDLAVASYRQAIEVDEASESIYLNSIC